MRIGFDLDGVLDRPAMRDLCNTLFDAGHECYVITGGLGDTGEWTEQARVTYLNRLGVKYTKLCRCIADNIQEVGRTKGEVCDTIKIDIFFDDSFIYMQEVEKYSKAIRCLVL